MRGILFSLILILATSGFVIAGPISEVRTDFHIGNLSTDSPEQNDVYDKINLKSTITYWIAALIVIMIIVTLSPKLFKKKKKVRKTKKTRRKK